MGKVQTWPYALVESPDGAGWNVRCPWGLCVFNPGVALEIARQAWTALNECHDKWKDRP